MCAYLEVRGMWIRIIGCLLELTEELMRVTNYSKYTLSETNEGSWRINSTSSRICIHQSRSPTSPSVVFKLIIVNILCLGVRVDSMKKTRQRNSTKTWHVRNLYNSIVRLCNLHHLLICTSLWNGFQERTNKEPQNMWANDMQKTRGSRQNFSLANASTGEEESIFIT